MTDQAAIRCLKNGDLSGLEILIARHQVKAVRAAYFIVQDEALAEDVVQDVFLSMQKHIHGIDDQRPFEPYLMRSVVHAALNVVRRRRREISLENGDEQVIERLLSQVASIEDQVEQAELDESTLAAIAHLPARQRAVIVQRYYLEMSEQEMAAALQAAPGTVKWLLHAARVRLRALLERQRSAK